jgi:cellulose synthase/poly-beta-1,6-N-acetylglucosamine synthase-like glycosyltransferase
MNNPIKPEEICRGCFELETGQTTWKVSGYCSISPDPLFDYFPSLKFKARQVDGWIYNVTQNNVISCIVPCYTESAKELERSILSLYRQRIPKGWRVEGVIVMDGADRMDDTMAEYLTTMFGVCINSNDPETDPFLKLPGAETIIVEPIDEDAALGRTPVMENTVGGFTLLVKRRNQRKENSLMWWLGSHAASISCKYALATDCGTVFAPTATMHMIRRMDAEPALHAVTGNQQCMTSEMQGDGSWEILHNPSAYCLRMLQKFEFEVSTM